MTADKSLREAAQLLGVSIFTLRRIVARRDIECRRIGSGRGTIRITTAAIEDYLQRRTVPALQPVAA